MYDLLLYDRPARSDAFRGNITALQRDTWKRTSAALGGYTSGRFLLQDLPQATLIDAFDRWLGFRIVEQSYGLTSWEGYIEEMRLLIDGVEYKRTLQPDWWHNYVNAYYSYPDTEDTEQGSLSYTTEGGDATFTDDAQDFTDYETAAGDATYRIRVTNADGTEAWCFLGASVSATEIYAYEEVELTTNGWNGETDGKTPSSYQVSNVELSGSRQNTGWTSDSDSISDYGRMEYVVSLAGTTPEAVAQIAAAHLAEFAWPRSRMTGGVTLQGGRAASNTRLLVRCAGFWETLNWRYRTASRIAAASDLVTALVGESEFVTAGTIETNDMAVKADADPIPQRLGDLLMTVAEQGDMDGDLWQIGVYNDQELDYEAAPTTVQYYLRNGRLVNRGGAPVLPTLLKPGFLLKNSNAPTGGQPPGSSDVWNDPRVAYVDEVVFEAPDQLQLRLFGEAESVITLAEQIRRGASPTRPEGVR